MKEFLGLLRKFTSRKLLVTILTGIVGFAAARGWIGAGLAQELGTLAVALAGLVYVIVQGGVDKK